MGSKIALYLLIAMGIPLLGSVIRSLINHRYRSAWMTLRVYLIVVAIYTTVLVGTTLALPIQMFPATETFISGDWTIEVLSKRRLPNDLDEYYELDFRMGNRSKQTIHGEKNVEVFLLTEDGTRHDPTPEPNDPPFDAEIKPGKYVITTRKFVMPTNLNRVELVIRKKGFRMDWFTIGRYPLDGRSVIVLQ